MHVENPVIMEMAHLGGGASDRKIGRDLPADAAFPTGMKKQIRNPGPRPPGHRMGRPALTPPATALGGRWRQRPHKSVVAGVTGHIRRPGPIVPGITAAPRGTWPPVPPARPRSWDWCRRDDQNPMIIRPNLECRIPAAS